MKIIGLLYLTSLSICMCQSKFVEKPEKSYEVRTKRQIFGLPLVFTYGATYKLIIGYALPVMSVDYAHFAFAVNFQYQYPELANITEVSRYYTYKIVSREQREADLELRKDDRLTFYTAVEKMLSTKGFNGPECLRRAICEVAQYPVEEEALVGEILHILLTPNYGSSPFSESKKDWSDDIMADYVSAYTAGKQMFDCASIYEGCPEGQGILELISDLQDE